MQPNGTKIFRLKIKIDGKDRRLTLGSFPEMSLAEKFIEWKESVLRAEATIRKYRECLKNDLLPSIGNNRHLKLLNSVVYFPPYANYSNCGNNAQVLIVCEFFERPFGKYAR